MKETKLFGTDGIRGQAMVELTPSLAYKTGKTLAIMSKNKTINKILVAGDTRLSTDCLKHALISGIISHGCDAVDIGIVPTPSVSNLVQSDFSYGVMITASHNPPQFNGFKIFNSSGNKLNKKEIKEFTFIYENTSDYGLQSFDKLGKSIINNDLIKKYVKEVVENINITFNPLKIALDCSFGATSLIAKNIFEKLEAKTTIFNCDFDGLNINKECGALHPEFLQKTMSFGDYDIGFAFDGDGDRIICVLKNGKVLDGDYILYILARYLNILNSLYGNKIVATILTNCGVEKSLEKYNINLIRTAVGDSNVNNTLQKEKLALGGEKAGHIIFNEFSKTGDGIYIACLLLKMQKLCGVSIEKLASECEIYPYIEENISVSNKIKDKILNLECIKNLLEQCLEMISDKGRIVLRPSGTEPKIRILVEGLDEQLNKEIVSILKNKIEEVSKLI